jgi:hypothetical protein
MLGKESEERSFDFTDGFNFSLGIKCWHCLCYCIFLPMNNIA